MTNWIQSSGADIANSAGITDRSTSELLNRNSSIYAGEKIGSIDGPGGIRKDGENAKSIGTMLNAAGTDSLFNPFKIFRYSKFGNGAGQYNIGKHKFIYNGDKSSDDSKQVFDNPTATQIIQWADEKAKNNGASPLYPYPYQINDFLWCKYYGKIPNNRLLTLRRYPIPVEDNLAIHESKMPLIPIAQAVTWWGGDTGNKLSSIFGITYGFNWEPLGTKVQDVQGNEVAAGKILDAVGITADQKIGGISGETARQIILASLYADPNNPLQATGADAMLQEYDKAAYDPDGPYWNRVLGPVNVVNTTQTRKEGLTYTQTIKLDFEYNLRSYGRVNPKVAMLDLISNFLSLTYSSAPFYGGGIRYFKQTGYTAPAFNTDAMDKGDYINGMMETVKAQTALIKSAAADFKKFAEKLQASFAGGDSITDNVINTVKELGNTRLANDIVGARMKDLIQAPLKMRSILDGRAVGEWHLMVGNPADPIAVIGNLCLKTTDITFSEELGDEDFPVSVKFSVTLDPGRPRAKQDIESMFNLGGGNLAYTALAEPSSSYGSYGEYVSKQLNTFNSAATSSQGSENSAANNLASYFSKNVARAYGEGFGKSGALPDYFNQLKTKD